ncbi:gallidermin/nisin family lantibiotic [Bacillus tropicus]|uniref:gallidermin/nisin family lantibiotic n=2 Tax=Bacillaceae TaxID=186817 RepID=UPI0008FE0D73
MNMGKKDLFDLDLQVKQNSSGVEPRITSVAACTPGTCWASCKGQATLKSNCCVGTFVCSLGGGC